MLNLNEFKYKRRNENGKKRCRDSCSENSDGGETERRATPAVKKNKSDFLSPGSGSEDEGTQELKNVDPFDDDGVESTPDSLESPLFTNKKKKSLLHNESNNHNEGISNGKQVASNGLGLSSSDSEDDDGVGTSRRVFPRLNCVITNSSPVTNANSDHRDDADVKITSPPNPAKTKVVGSSNKEWEETPTAGKEIDENFTYEEDDFGSDSSDDDYPDFGKKRRQAVLGFLQTIKMSTTKHLTPEILYSCSDLLKQRALLNRLLEQCRSISSVLTTAIEKLHCSDNMTDGIATVKTPSIIPSHLKLKPYQLVGLNWMALLHRHKVNGVLADEMGLGKTVQTIAFLAHLFEQDPETGPHLIVVPSSTLGNWQREFDLWCPSIDVVLYQGSQPDRRALRVDFSRGRTANVILTTYNSAISTPEDRGFFRKLTTEYAIFDEGHMLKNMSSQRYVNLMKIKAMRKLLLTGTPLQNNLLELMSLLRFVMPHMFEQTTESLIRIFKHSNSESKGKYALNRIADAKNIMQPFVLRRLKSAVLKQLPSKSVETVFCDMTEEQNEVYDKTKEKFKLGLSKRSSLEMRSAFTELRKAANHPLLRRTHYQASLLTQMAKLLKKYESAYHDSVEKLIVEDLTVMTDFEIHQFCLTTPSVRRFALDKTAVLNSGKFKVLDKFLPDIESKGEKVVIFSQWTMIIDILEKYLHQRGYKFLRLDGSTPVNTRLGLIDKFESDSRIMIFLLSTKAGGLGINLTAASRVILHDIDLNPHNDKQAEDRCHRLGQTKDVKIIRLISKNSIEEGMLRLAENKLKLEEQLSAERDDSADIATLLQNTLTR